MKDAFKPSLSLLFALLAAAGLAAQGSSQTKWNVTEPFGPATPVSFDTNEGTWMNVDVSPDGHTVEIRWLRRPGHDHYVTVERTSHVRRVHESEEGML